MAKIYFYAMAVAVCLGAVSAITDDEREAVKNAVRPLLESCGEEFSVTEEQIVAAKEAGNFDAFDPCFYACFFKKAGFIDDSGLLDVNVVLEKNKKYIKGEDDVAKIEEIGVTCISVNDQSVGDGEKGCERSKLLLDCFIKEKANFSPFAAN